jgi:FkbM family methyltransferase
LLLAYHMHTFAFEGKNYLYNKSIQLDSLDLFNCDNRARGKATEHQIFTDQPTFPLVEPDVGDLGFVSWFGTNEVEQRIGELVVQFSKLFDPKEYYVIDAGMNRGFFTMLSSRLGYSVISFEISPVCICKAVASLDSLGLRARVQVNMVGLSQFDGGHISLGGVGCDAGQSAKTKPVEKLGTVPLLSLRKSLSRNKAPKKKIAILKMDIEGSELDVLVGFGIESFLRYHVQNLIVETASHLWGDKKIFDTGLMFFEELAGRYAGVYCLDPNLSDPSCTFETEKQVPYQGLLHKVVNMFQVLDRNKEGDCCCGNIWFKDVIA